jgi:hypothetical protein
VADLDPDGFPVYLTDSIVVTSPGLSGQIELSEGSGPGTRAADIATPAFVQALQDVGLLDQITIEITEHNETAPGGGSRGGGGGDEITLSVPGPGQGFGQALLYAAEDQSLSWHFPVDLPLAEVPTRGPAQLTYRVPRAIVPSAVEPGSRGVIGVVGKKVLKILIFRLVDLAAGAAANHFVSHYETQNRPHRFRTFEPVSYGQAGRDLVAADWTALATGRALLFVHGTASRTQSAFGPIPRSLVDTLHARYDGRVFAFDHPTISVDPRDNVRWFAANLGADVDIDIVAHSRGGLVSRLLAEQGASFGLSGRLTVSSAVLVASPNSGTALVDRANLNQLINRYTNLIQFVPDNGVTDALDIVLSLVKQIAIGALGGLDGLTSMDPRGTFLEDDLNRSGRCQTTYRAVGSDYEPPGGSGMLRVARDAATDLVFRAASNDLVVPTLGAYEAPGAASFPVTSRLLFAKQDAVDHSGYWNRPQFVSALNEWLTG